MINGITATGNNPNNALILGGTGQITSYDVQVVPPGSGIRMPMFIEVPSVCLIRNSGANVLTIYPAVGGTINGSGGGYALALAGLAEFWALSALDWITSAVGGGGAIPATGNIITQYSGGVIIPSGTSGTITLDLSTSNRFAPAALTGATTFAFSNAPTGRSQSFILEVVPGGNTIAWPGTVKWPGGTAPVPTATAGKTDVFAFYWNGTSYFGGTYGQNY